MPQLKRILETLVEFDVEFIVVGGLAAVLQGAPVTTQDVDIVYSLSEANQTRLLAALKALGALFRGDPRRLEPTMSHLASRGHKLLTTPHGDLDCLGTIEEATTYDQLLSHVDWMEVGGKRIRVLSLPRLILVKERLARPKDQLMLLQLQATLDERRKMEGETSD